MTTEKALTLASPVIIIFGAIVIVIAIWLYFAFTRPRNKRIAILLNGLGVISFLVGEAITHGPNPKHYYNGSRYRTIPSGPRWGIIVGLSLAVVLWIIARYFAKKKS
jgi:hypothetical protein